MAAQLDMEAARELLVACGQEKIISELDKAGQWPESLLAQLSKLNSAYPGGLKVNKAEHSSILQAHS